MSDIHERRQGEQQRQEHLHFMESMDRINRAMQKADDLDRMMSDVLDVVLDIFACDRAALVYPCDPESATWTARMERTRPEYPGIHDLGIEMDTGEEVVAVFQALLDADAAVRFGPESGNPIPPDVAKQFNIRSQIGIAIFPKGDKPWMFVLHQCSGPRNWTDEEARLLQEIGRRLSDGLTSLLAMRHLRESEEKYRRFVETSNEGILQLDQNNRITFVNARMAEMIGYPEEELIGQLATDFMFPDQVADHDQHIASRRKGISESYERRIRCKDGGELWVVVSATPLFNDKADFQGSFGMLTDITELKQAEEKARQSEQRLRLHSELSPLGFLEWDENFCATEWNAACEQIFGYTREEVIGQHANLILPEEVRGMVDEIFNALMHQTGGQHSINENITKDGRRIIVEWFNTTLIDNDGKANGVASICRDITERKRAETELALSEEKFSKAFHASPNLMAITNPEDGRIVEINEAFCRLFGYTRDECIGHTTTELRMWVDPKQRASALRKLEETEEALYMPLELRTKSGEIRSVIDSMTFIHLGERKYLLSVATDITEREQAEEELREQQGLLLEAQRIAHMGSWHMDLATNEVFWSETLYRMYGYDPALPPPLYTESEKLFMPESWQRLSSAITRLVETGIPYELELEMVPKAGDNKWMLARGELVRDAHDRPTRIRGVVQDITERKLAEKELLASEQLFRALVENSPDFIARYDLQFRRVYVNPAIRKLFSSLSQDLLGKTPEERSPVQAPEDYIEHLQQVIETGSESTLETLFRTAEGELHWGQIRFSPEFDADGNVTSVLTIGRDIHQIKESEQRLRRFIANLPAFFFTFRRTGEEQYCFPYASPGIKTIYGLEPEDVRKDMAPLHMLAHPDDRPRIEAEIARAFESLEPFRVEYRVCRPKLPERWIEARSVPHEEVDGSILWYGIMLDITERKRAELELDRLNREQQAISNSTQSMLKAADEQTLLDEVCNIICDQAGYRLAWVGYGENDEDKTIRPVAWAGEGSDYVAHARLSWSDEAEHGQGPAGIVIRSGESIYVPDFENDTLMAPWRENALQHGYRSGIALPLKDENDQPFGALLIYSGEKDAINPHESRLLEELAGDLAFGICSLRARARSRQAGEALEASEKLQRLLLDTLTQQIYYKDRDLRYIACNQTFARELGIQPQDVVGKTDFDLFPKELAERYRADDQSIIQSGETRTIEEPYESGEKKLWVQTVKTPMRDASGEVTGVLGISWDITERRRAAHALEQSQARLAEAQRIARLGNWELDLETNQLAWSDEVHDIFETDKQTFAAVYESYLDLVHPDDRQTVDRAYQESISNKTPYDIDYRLQMSDGRIKYVNGHCETIFDEDGKPLRSFGTVQDVTRQHEVEEQLRQAQKMEAIGTLVGGIAHDFNNKLAAITGNLYLALRDTTGNKQAEAHLKGIEQLSFEAATMVKQLLTFARKGTIQMTPLGLVTFIKEAAKLNRIAIPEDIRLSIDYADDPLPVLGDVTQLQQLFLNLLTNARDALQDTKHPRIDISLDRYEPDAAFREHHPEADTDTTFACLKVCDNGAGIEPQNLEQIFDPFFTTKEVGKGTGLGLAMVYGVVQSHRGIVDVDSRPGKGTCFSIYLPLHSETEDMSMPYQQSRIIEGQGETILLADDDANVLETFAEMLESINYRVLQARNGREAIELYNQHAGDIDLVILDMVMPEMKGSQVATHIHDIDPDAKVLFATGYDSKLNADRGADGIEVLDKPYLLDHVSKTIRRLLDD